MVAFLREIGLAVRFGPVSAKTVNPGLTIERGVLVIDESRLRYPGDLLHEAGHLAILTPEARSAAGGNVGRGGEELAAIAWSYAATLHLAIDPSVVFHPGGYRGGGAAIVEGYASGSTMGVPLLEWFEMCDRRGGDKAFPQMRHWLNPTARAVAPEIART